MLICLVVHTWLLVLKRKGNVLALPWLHLSKKMSMKFLLLSGETYVLRILNKQRISGLMFNDALMEWWCSCAVINEVVCSCAVINGVVLFLCCH